MARELARIRRPMHLLGAVAIMAAMLVGCAEGLAGDRSHGVVPTQEAVPTSMTGSDATPNAEPAGEPADQVLFRATIEGNEVVVVDDGHLCVRTQSIVTQPGLQDGARLRCDVDGEFVFSAVEVVPGRWAVVVVRPDGELAEMSAVSDEGTFRTGEPGDAVMFLDVPGELTEVKVWKDGALWIDAWAPF